VEVEKKKSSGQPSARIRGGARLINARLREGALYVSFSHIKNIPVKLRCWYIILTTF